MPCRHHESGKNPRLTLVCPCKQNYKFFSSRPAMNPIVHLWKSRRDVEVLLFTIQSLFIIFQTRRCIMDNVNCFNSNLTIDSIKCRLQIVYCIIRVSTHDISTTLNNSKCNAIQVFLFQSSNKIFICFCYFKQLKIWECFNKSLCIWNIAKCLIVIADEFKFLFIRSKECLV